MKTTRELINLCEELLDDNSEEMQLDAVQQNGLAIRDIKNPSEQVQLAAVQQNGYAIQYIKNPSEQVQLAAVKQNGLAIQFIKNPGKQVQLAAVKQNRDAIKYIKKSNLGDKGLLGEVLPSPNAERLIRKLGMIQAEANKLKLYSLEDGLNTFIQSMVNIYL